MKHKLYYVILFFFILLSRGDIAKLVDVKSDYFEYNESDKHVLLKDNVEIIVNDSTIKADSLLLDTEKLHVISTKNVVISKDNNTLNSSSLDLNLKTNEIKLSELKFAMKPEGLKGNLYVTVKQLHQLPSFQWGTWGFITSCNLPDKQHHFIKSWKFLYKPEKHVTLYGAYLYNKFTFFPFNLTPIPVPILEFIPIPYYRYNIGKRRIVWGFPTISKKKTTGWGWVVQNSFDYNYTNGKDSSVYIDWYQTHNTRKGALGYGIKHHYDMNDHDGTLYYYNYDYSQIENNNRVQLHNSIYSINHTSTLSEFSSLNLLYKNIDVEEKIKSRGSDKRLSKKLDYSWSKYGDIFTFNINENQNFLQNKKDLKFILNRKHYYYHSYQFDYSQLNYYSTSRELSKGNISYSKNLFNFVDFNQKLNYQQVDYSNDNNVADESLKSYTTFKKALPYKINFTLKMNQFFDLDQENYTADSSSNNNNFLASSPEMIFQKSNYNFFNMKHSSTLTIGHYDEVKYIAAEGSAYKFPNYASSFLEPNMYYLKHKVSKSFSKLPFKTTVSLNTAYDQYIFKNENLSLFEGDAQYSLSMSSKIKSTFFNFIKLNTSLNRRYSPDESNSPFYAFKKSVSELNKANGSLTFFYKQKLNLFPYEVDFDFTGSSSYNWLRDGTPWNPLQYKLKLHLTNRFKFSMSTSQKLNYSFSQKETIYTPLIINLKTIPFKKSYFNYNITIDLNDWAFQDMFDIKSSSFNLNFPLGKLKAYRWNFRTTFTYMASKQPANDNKYVLDYYELQTLSIVKKEHNRTLEIGYKKTNDELFIKYNFTLFPEDPIVIKKRNNIWTFEGRLKQASVERFK